MGDEPMPEVEQCPRCSSPHVVHGAIAPRAGFRAKELRLFSLSFQLPAVPVPGAAVACAACGLVWGELDAGVLRQKLHDLGNEKVKRRLGLAEGV
jgi:hypothetical protein